METIERRSTAVGSVREVVHAIWSLARSELPLAESAAREARAYVDWVEQALLRVALPPARTESEEALHVVIGPERSYSGALPARAVRGLPTTGELGLVGTRFTEVALRDPKIAARVAFELPGASVVADADAVGRGIAHALLEHAASRTVTLHHAADVSGRLEHKLLVFRRGATPYFHPDTFSSVDVVADAVLVEAVSSHLIAAVAEAFCSEVSARMLAAERAKLACDRRLEDLTQQWRTARQERITNELLEAVAGAQALRHSGPLTGQ